MASDAFIRSLLSRGDGLFTRIHQFNFGLSGYVDRTHVEEDFLVNHWDEIRGGERVKTKLSRYLIGLFGLEGRLWYDFEDVRLRLALMDREVLERLMVYAGAGMYEARVSKMILKDEVRAFKESVGEEVYFFITKRGPLLRNLVPEVRLVGEDEVLTKETFYRHGKECLEMCLSGEDSAVVDRLALKFPKKMVWNFNGEGHEAYKMKAWGYLHRLLVKEIEPRLKVCFT